MRRLASVLVLFAGVLAAQQPGTPIFTLVGSLSCGMRMITPGQVQTWCYTGTFPNQTLIHNQIDGLAAPSNPSTVFVLVPAAVSSVAFLESNGNMTLVTWMIANGWLYQIVSTTCTPPPPGTQGSNGCIQGPLATGQLSQATAQ